MLPLRGGAGVHRRGLRKRNSFSPGLHNIAFKPIRLVKWKIKNKATHYRGRNIYILSASQTAIKAPEVSR
jgi:hypothetical protein